MQLESRQLLATFRVTTAADSGPGSLRQAILDANGLDGPDDIRFAIGGGLQSISPLSPLPAITGPVAIDGTSQPNAGARDPRLPRIELNGSSMGSGPGLNITGPGVSVRGLAINQMPGVGVSISGAGGALVASCFIGTSADGNTPRGNRDTGLFIDNAPNNSIGGPGPSEGNLISGNIFNGAATSGNGVRILGQASTGNLIRNNIIGLDITAGVFLSNGGNGVALNNAPGNVIRDNIISGNNLAGVLIVRTGSTGNRIAGNLIGTNPDGLQFPNNIDGVELIEAGSNTVGGNTDADRNMISGNGGPGISLRGPNATGNLVAGNYVGTTPDGLRALGNVGDGILIQNASGNVIGGNTPGAANVIARNRTGINLQTTPPEELQGSDLGRFFTDGHADRNAILGNLLGIGADRSSPLGNLLAGVSIIDGADNSIGGTSAGARNVISANLGVGIQISSDESTGNRIVGNAIGTDPSGLSAIPNVSNGILIDSASGNLIGGDSSSARNLISGNQGNGIRITDPTATSNRVLGNWIGVDATGLKALGNFGDGVRLDNGTSGNAVGGNVLSGNGGSGLQLLQNVAGNLVAGNMLGLGADGSMPLGNNLSGVQLTSGSHGNTIGGTSAGDGNIIGSNVTGVGLAGPGTSGNLLLGNRIGTDRSGSLPRGNTAYGILIADRASGNVIGGASGNIISANGLGITIIGPSTGQTLIQGNRIGTDATGTRALGNLQNGIFFRQSSNNTVGGTTAGAGNLISANRAVGIQVFSEDSTGNQILGNRMGTDATGRRNVDDRGQFLGNGLNGILLDNAPGNVVGGLVPGAGNLLSGNQGAGVLVSGLAARGNRIVGNLIGTDPTGTLAVGNTQFGVQVLDAPGTSIGSPVDGGSNLISGNLVAGISLGGSGAVGVVVTANRIGTDRSGTKPLGNGRSGIAVTGSPLASIGGTAAGAGNLISGNGLEGINVGGSRTGTLWILGNLIGTNASGRTALSNSGDGVLLDGTADVLVGSSNLISGNGLAGVHVRGADTRRIKILGSRIGTSANGLAAIPNQDGVLIDDARGVQVGGARAGDANLISGNLDSGVQILGAKSGVNFVLGNRIGTDATGRVALGNAIGIQVDGSPANTLGGPNLSGGNLISGNAQVGVQILGDGATGNLVIGNRIGTNADASAALRLASTPSVGVLINNASGNLVGDPAKPGSGNVIVGHQVGVVVAGFGARGNVLAGNRIGTDATGSKALPNTVGVYINGAPSNSIGGGVASASNLISGNSSTGITVFGALSTGNVIAGNRIGTDAGGGKALPNVTGIYLESAPGNVIGGSTAALGNLISGNTSTAVYLFQALTVGNVIRNNRIGTNASGGPGPGNGQYGVLLFNAPTNTVDRSKPSGNRFFGNGIADVREFTGRVNTSNRSATAVPLVTAPAGKVRKAVPQPPKFKKGTRPAVGRGVSKQAVGK